MKPDYTKHNSFTILNQECTNLPHSIRDIVAYTQNICLHMHWVKHYGVTPSDAQNESIHLKTVSQKQQWLQKEALDPTHTIAPDRRLLGICRDFSLITTSLCREANIPARLRAGFADYLEQGKYSDHWIVEVLQDNQWIMVDPQMDMIQSQILDLSFDPLNLPYPRFINGAQAWLLCRNNQDDPQRFGIFKWWGWQYLIINLLLDANSLIGKPMHPWDMWEGYKSLPLESWTEEDYNTMDDLAQLILNCDDDYESFFKFVINDGRIEAPDDLSKITQGFL